MAAHQPSRSRKEVPTGSSVSQQQQQEQITLSTLPILWQHINTAEHSSTVVYKARNKPHPSNSAGALLNWTVRQYLHLCQYKCISSDIAASTKFFRVIRTMKCLGSILSLSFKCFHKSLASQNKAAVSCSAG